MKIEIADLIGEIEQGRKNLNEIETIYRQRLAGLTEKECSLEKAVLLAWFKFYA